MTKKERIAVAVTGVVLFCVAALFSISIFLGALDFGFSSGRNVLFLLGGMLFSVYGFCSVLIPVFFFVAGAFCLSAKWSVQRAFILLVSVIPFFTLVAAERTCLAIAAQDSNPVATVKIISLVAIALLLVALEYLVTVTVAGLVEKALERQFSFKEFFDDLEANIKAAVFQALKLKKDDIDEIAKDESDAKGDLAPSRAKAAVQPTVTAASAASAKHSPAPHEEAEPLDWSIDSEGNVKGSAAHDQSTSDAASTHEAKPTQVGKEIGGKSSSTAADTSYTADAIDLIGEFEKNSLDLTVQIAGRTHPQGDFDAYADEAGVQDETPKDEERFFDDDELLEDDFAQDEDVEEIDDDFEDQEYLSAIDETEIQEIEASPQDSDDFEFYEGFQEEPEDDQPLDTGEEGDFFDEVQKAQQQGALDQGRGAADEYFDEPAGAQERQGESEYFDEPVADGTAGAYIEDAAGEGGAARDDEPVDERQISEDEPEYFDEPRVLQAEGVHEATDSGEGDYFDEPSEVAPDSALETTDAGEPEYFDEPTGMQQVNEPRIAGDGEREHIGEDSDAEPEGAEETVVGSESEYFDEPTGMQESNVPESAGGGESEYFDESPSAAIGDGAAVAAGDEAGDVSGEEPYGTPEPTDEGESEYFGEPSIVQAESVHEATQTSVDGEPEGSREKERAAGGSEDFPEPHLESDVDASGEAGGSEEPADFPQQDEYSAEGEDTLPEGEMGDDADDFAEPLIDTAEDTYDATEEREFDEEPKIPPTQEESAEDASYLGDEGYDEGDEGYIAESEDEGIYSTEAGYIEESEDEPEITQVDVAAQDDEPPYPEEAEDEEEEDDDISVVDEDLGYLDEETEIDSRELGDEASEEDVGEEEEYFGEVSDEAGDGDEVELGEDDDAGEKEDNGEPVVDTDGDEAADDGKEQFTSLESIFKKMEQDAITLAQKSLPSNEVTLPLDQLTHGSAAPDDTPPRRSTGPYKISEDLLTAYDENEYWIIDEETQNAAKCLKDTLSEFKIEAEVTGIRKGPVVTMFEMLPAPGVKLSRIVALSDNIALRLAASSVRIVAPIPGKRAVGIEVPNKNRAIVSFRECIEQDRSEWKKMAVPVVLGKDIQGETQIMDLVKTPHLLIAGSTGAGKSVCVNSMILSILYKRNPHEVKLILIDPKIVELKLYNGIPHLLTPVITEPKKAMQALQYCLCEMERRYSVLDGMGCRDIASYNRKIVEQHIATEKLPYIVVIIDEFADLMATTGKALESVVARLAAMSRAVGIHLVLATQRPSVDVITGLIKANIPSRIAFMVAAKMDSRIIIDQVGAEKLLGKGDMLYASSTDPFPVRIQGAFVSDQEVENVAQAAKEWGEPEYIDDEIFVDDEEGEEEQSALFEEGEDPLYEKALDAVIQAGKASASYVQRKLSIGYNRAARLIEEMEERGIVGPANGSKPREIIHVP